MRNMAFLLVVLMASVPVWGQEQQVWLPVDQTVADYDPLATSQRWLDPGIGQFSTRVDLFAPQHQTDMRVFGQPVINPATGLVLPDQYQLRTPGVHAFLNRPEYFVQTGPGERDFAFNKVPFQDGAFVGIASADTVFNLIPQLASPQVGLPLKPIFDARVNWRIDTRINGRIDGQINMMIDAQVEADASIPHAVR